MAYRNNFADPETYAIIGAAMEVHRALGCGFVESVYRRALAVEFTARKIPFAAEVPVVVTYKGHQLPGGFRADFICHESVIVEVKAMVMLGSAEQAQAINYLRATNLQRAILLNFGTSSLQHRRVVRHLSLVRDPVQLRGEPPDAGSSAHVLVIREPLSKGPQEPAGVPGNGDSRDGSADTRGE